MDQVIKHAHKRRKCSFARSSIRSLDHFICSAINISGALPQARVVPRRSVLSSRARGNGFFFVNERRREATVNTLNRFTRQFNLRKTFSIWSVYCKLNLQISGTQRWWRRLACSVAPIQLIWIKFQFGQKHLFSYRRVSRPNNWRANCVIETFFRSSFSLFWCVLSVRISLFARNNRIPWDYYSNFNSRSRGL